MAVASVVAQHIQNARPKAQAAVLRQVHLGGDGIHLGEFEPQRLTAQQIRILPDGLHRIRAQMPVDLHRPHRADAEPAQVSNRLPHTEHAAEFVADGHGLIRRDAPQNGELFRLVGDYLQAVRTEGFHQLFRGGGPDVGQRTAGKICKSGGLILGHGGLAGGSFELGAVGRMVFEMAVKSNAFAHVHFAQHAGNHMQLAPGVHLKYHIAGILVFINQMLNGAFHPHQLLFLLHFLCPPLAAFRVSFIGWFLPGPPFPAGCPGSGRCAAAPAPPQCSG